MSLRSLMSALVNRSRYSNAGKTFNNKRDIFKALGYKRELLSQDYRLRFERNSVANRIVKAYPKATWRGGAEVIEDEDPRTMTDFETQFDLLNKRLKVWSTFLRADILAGVQRYAIIVIGGPGELDQPLEKCTADQIQFLMPYAEDEAKITKWVTDPKDPRFGLPERYTLNRGQRTPEMPLGQSLARPVHWTRCIHVADGLLDDDIYGEPRLRAPWNDLDDLEKVRGGGAEAFWKRADQGIQFDLDPELEFEAEDDDTSEQSAAHKATREQIEEYEHGLRRYLFTRGVTANSLGSDVADFGGPVNAIISLISAATEIPQRVLMGSEQAKLASKTDRSNWDDHVTDRRELYADPLLVRPFIDRLIQLGALPEPAQYEVRWPQLKVLDDTQRAEVATAWAQLNQLAGEVVVTGDEIRDRVLGLEELDAAQKKTFTTNPKAAMFVRKMRVLSASKREFYLDKILGSRKERSRWQAIHTVADRFRAGDPTDGDTGLRAGARGREAHGVGASATGARRTADFVPGQSRHRRDA